MAVLACLVMDNLFPDAGKSGLLGQHRDVAVHFAVEVDGFDDLAAVGFQSAVEIVQGEPGGPSGDPVVQFGREGLRERVVAFLFPAGDQVVAFLGDHAVHLGQFVRRILQVGVHREDDFAFRCAKSGAQGQGFALVAPQFAPPHGRVVSSHRFDGLPRAVGGAVVHIDGFVGEPFAGHHPPDPVVEFAQGFLFVVQRDDDRYLHVRCPFLFSVAVPGNDSRERISSWVVLREDRGHPVGRTRSKWPRRSLRRPGVRECKKSRRRKARS